MIKRLWIFLLITVLSFSMTACDDDYEDYDDYDEEDDYEESADSDQTWSIYWYLCGSDLESDYGAATDDLYEMMDACLPENVRVVIQTGGADMWWDDNIDSEMTERYVYDGDEMELVDQQPMENMGEAETLADFLSFCTENYPADRTAVIFWNHGGGSVAGASFDENYDYDSLTLSEFYQAFDSVFDLSTENPPIDLIGFDTCLMATIDTAYTFYDIADYLVASAEFEPGSGWAYGEWLQALGDDPGMSPADLGKVICDTFYEDCEWYDCEDEATLSVVDLSKAGPLFDAYEGMGVEALTYALEDVSFFSDFGRQAVQTENYGGNTRDLGYANMVDLGHLAGNCSELLPEMSQEVIDCLNDCVIYQKNGYYHENGTGLSCYFSYNGDLNELDDYMTEGCSDAFKYFFGYGLAGVFPEDGVEFINSLGYEEEDVEQVPDLEENGEEEYPLYLDEEGYAVLELDQDILNMLKGVYFQLAYIDEEEDIMIMLGQDNDIDSDWDNGIFKDNFRGVWGSIDGYPVYMEISYEGEDYTAYSVPILLNDEEYNLRVIYDYNDEEFYILGARKGLDDNGMADKNLIQLQPGDEITTIHYAATISGDDDFQAVPIDTFTVTEDTSFSEIDMGDGDYLMTFELVDAKNNTAYSEMIQFSVNGDDIDVEILD